VNESLKTLCKFSVESQTKWSQAVDEHSQTQSASEPHWLLQRNQLLMMLLMMMLRSRPSPLPPGLSDNWRTSFDGWPVAYLGGGV